MTRSLLATQAAFSFGELKDEQKRVVVCTVGGHFGVVMYELGQQVTFPCSLIPSRGHLPSISESQSDECIDAGDTPSNTERFDGYSRMDCPW